MAVVSKIQMIYKFLSSRYKIKIPSEIGPDIALLCLLKHLKQIFQITVSL